MQYTLTIPKENLLMFLTEQLSLVCGFEEFKGNPRCTLTAKKDLGPIFDLVNVQMDIPGKEALALLNESLLLDGLNLTDIAFSYCAEEGAKVILKNR